MVRCLSLLVSCVLLFVVAGFGTETKAQQMYPVPAKWELNYNPVPLLGFFPSHRIGVEWHGSGNRIYGLQLGFAWTGIVADGPLPLRWQNNYRLLDLRFEVKKVMTRRKDWLLYGSVEPYYSHARDRLTDQHFKLMSDDFLTHYCLVLYMPMKK